MNLKTYTARSMAAALSLVKQDLGNDAVILHTRNYKRGGLFGFGGHHVVEITAGRGADVGRARRRTAPTPRKQPVAVRKDTYLPSSTNRHAVDTAIPQQPAAAGDLIKRTYEAARLEMASNHTNQSSTMYPQSAHNSEDHHSSQIKQEMHEIRRMVAHMMRRQRSREATGPARPDMPDKLFDLYMGLLEQEVTEELAEEVIEQVRRKLNDEQLNDEKAVRQAVLEAIGRLIPTDNDAWELKKSTDGRPRTIMLIGPTGVGKTTTIAKLAATFKLKQKKSVGLITMDTYRIAAVEQLQTYARILGLPLHIVGNTEQIIEATNACRNCDVVLIDTAGRSQRDDPKLEQLKGFIQTADPHEVHLVLSSTCTQSVLLDTAQRFAAIRTDKMIFTKLDEAVSFGVLLNVARKVNKRLSYVTTGQEVPHQIEPGRSDRLAELVLGGQV